MENLEQKTQVDASTLRRVSPEQAATLGFTELFTWDSKYDARLFTIQNRKHLIDLLGEDAEMDFTLLGTVVDTSSVSTFYVIEISDSKRGWRLPDNCVEPFSNSGDAKKYVQQHQEKDFMTDKKFVYRITEYHNGTRKIVPNT